MKYRWVFIASCVGAVIVGGWLSTGAPRFTAVNAGFSVTYPWSRGLGALLVAAALGGIVALVSKTWIRVGSCLLAGLSVWVGFHLLTYRLDTTYDGIASQSRFVHEEIAWRDVVDVGLDVDFIVLAGTGKRRIEIDTTDFTFEQRATLNRTISRRVAEISSQGPIVRN
jgi:hypothetical protein